MGSEANTPAAAHLPEVVVYSRHGCHLCEVVEAQLARLQTGLAFEVRVVDVDTDDDLVERFGEQVPVVCIDGRKAFKYRLDEQAFARKLRVR